MINKDEFDYLIKKNLVDMLGNGSFAFEIAGWSYDVYYNREAYKKFIAEMQSDKYKRFYNQYNRGQGSELIEKDNKPPKMDLESEQRQIDVVFEELEDEIKNIFSSKPIQNFTSKNHIKLSAIAEYSKAMEPLSKENIISLF